MASKKAKPPYLMSNGAGLVINPAQIAYVYGSLERIISEIGTWGGGKLKAQVKSELKNSKRI